MLQRYTFIKDHPVNKLNESLYAFFRNIEHVGPNDTFNHKVHLPQLLADKTNRKDSALRKRFEAFFNEYKRLGGNRQNVLSAFLSMNDIQGLFQCKNQRETISSLPSSIKKETEELFDFLYSKTLNSIGDIKNHYEEFVKVQDNNWCAFCGMEQLIHFTHQKQDYDHLLAKSIYPFAAVNMKNLAPMCIKCNRVHKRAKDLIFYKNNQCKAVNPFYGKKDIRISFDGTKLPTALNRKGKWKICFLPKAEEVERWNEVFRIGDRIVKDLFTSGKKTDYDVWLDDFIKIYKRRNDLKPFDEKKVKEAFKDYARGFISERYREKRYVKYYLFMWIAKKAPDSFIKAKMRALN